MVRKKKRKEAEQERKMKINWGKWIGEQVVEQKSFIYWVGTAELLKAREKIKKAESGMLYKVGTGEKRQNIFICILGS